MRPIVALGLLDITQKKQAIRRNFPVLGRMRYMLELIRPELYRYFVESDFAYWRAAKWPPVFRC